MGLFYLFKNRERPALLSSRWLKVWGKRGWNIFGLLKIIIRQQAYRILGAEIGDLSVVGVVDANGSMKRLKIGRGTSVGDGVHFALHEDIIIGDMVTINSGVKIFTASHDTSSSKWLMFSKPVVINEYAWIASGAILLPGVVIGKGAVVGAGSVVANNVPDYAVVVGNPSRIVGVRCENLDYVPSAFCAPYEAWLGMPTKNKDVMPLL